MHSAIVGLGSGSISSCSSNSPNGSGHYSEFGGWCGPDEPYGANTNNGTSEQFIVSNNGGNNESVPPQPTGNLPVNAYYDFPSHHHQTVVNSSDAQNGPSFMIPHHHRPSGDMMDSTECCGPMAAVGSSGHEFYSSKSPDHYGYGWEYHGNTSPDPSRPHSPGRPPKPTVKRRNTANKKERRRTQSINNAFADLRDCIPNVPPDTKLSKFMSPTNC